MAETHDRARDEFFSEAQEIIEGLRRDLLAPTSHRGLDAPIPTSSQNILDNIKDI